MKTSKLLTILGVACICSSAFAQNTIFPSVGHQGGGDSVFATSDENIMDDNENVVAVPVAPVYANQYYYDNPNDINARLQAQRNNPELRDNLQDNLDRTGDRQNIRDREDLQQRRGDFQQRRGGVGRR